MTTLPQTKTNNQNLSESDLLWLQDGISAKLGKASAILQCLFHAAQGDIEGYVSNQDDIAWLVLAIDDLVREANKDSSAMYDGFRKLLEQQKLTANK